MGIGLNARRWTGAAAITVAAVVGCSQTARAADPGWQSPVNVPHASWPGPQFIANGSEGFLYLRQEQASNGYTVDVTHVPASGDEVTTETLSGSGLSPHLAANTDGFAVAAWDELAYEPCCDGLGLATRDPGATFTQPAAVPGTRWGSDPQVAVNGSGDAVVVYTDWPYHDNTNRTEVWAVFRDADGTFSEPQQIGETHAEGMTPHYEVGLDDDGNAVVMLTWGGVIHAAIGTASGFDDPVRISTPDGVSEYPPVFAVAESGGAVIGWADWIFTGTTIIDRKYVSIRRPSQGFSPPIRLAGAAAGGVGPALADDGRGLLAYLDADWYPVVRPVNTDAGTLGAPIRIPSIYGAGVRVSPEGRAIWLTSNQVAWGDVSGTFNPPTTLFCHASVSQAVLGSDDNAGLLVFPHADIDQLGVMRSDPAVPPQSSLSCPTRPPYLPETPQQARLVARMPDRVRLGRSGTFPVVALSTAAGRLEVTGKARVGRAKVRLKGTGTRPVGIGVARFDLRVPKPMMRRLRDSDTGRGRVSVELVLHHDRGTTETRAAAGMRR